MLPGPRTNPPPRGVVGSWVLAVGACLALAACGQLRPAGEGVPDPMPDRWDDPADDADPSVSTPPESELEVHFIDAGQGDATLLVGGGVTVLVDAGRHTATDVVDYLDGQGLEAIDVVAITHPHADHIGQFDRVLERFAVTEVWWSPSTHTTDTFDRSLAALEASEAAFEEPVAGDSTQIGPLHIEFVNPVPGGSGGDLHDNGLAFRVTYGEVAFLFTGDAERQTEPRLVAEHAPALAAEVYQVGHHGSATSTSAGFLEAVAPRVAVYSAGQGNQHGHPHREVVDRLVGTGAAVYGTDVHGTVVVTTDGAGLRVDTATGAPALTGPGSQP